MKRRQFNQVLMGLASAASLKSTFSVAANAPGRRSLFYAGSGSSLYGYALDTASRSLKLAFGPYVLPEEIQAAWQNPRSGHLYVASSQGFNGTRHFLSAFAVGRDGALTPVGEPTVLPQRPINITVDHRGRFVLVAYPRPSGITVHRIGMDGAIAGQVVQAASLDTGIYPHEVRVFPSDSTVLTMSRGTEATPTAPEQLGAIRLYSFRNGQLANVQAVSRDGGRNFRPRNIEFSRSGRWLYAVLEAQNQVLTYDVHRDRLSEDPVFTASTLPASATGTGQQASGCRMHPEARVFYVINRALGTEEFQGQKVQAGEESVAVFALDPHSGEPRLVQSAPLPGYGSRALGISPDGRWLVAAGFNRGARRVGDRVEAIPVGLCLYGIAADGQLTFNSRLDVPLQDKATIWSGCVLY